MPAVPSLRLAVVDNHPIFVRGLELLLPATTDGRVEVVGSTGDASAAASLVQRCLPDLVLVDLHMPPPGGVRALAAIRRTVPRTRLVAMAEAEETAPALEALRAGAEGFLPKSSAPEELLPPLLAVLDGWSVLPGGLLRSLLHAPRPLPSSLDVEERRLLQLIAAGRTTVEIGEELHVSARTVKRMTAALLRKLRVANRTEAAAFAGRAGLLGG